MNRTISEIQSFEAFKSKSYFNGLDGLRGIAILMVLAHHVPRYANGHPLLTLQENGRYGVALFFVISGFLICTLFLREEERNGRIDLWKFYGRRALRLLPLYYVALGLQTILVFGFHHHSPENQLLFREKLPAYLFYFSNWLPTATQGPFFCAWSLAVEEQFYLLFGFLFAFGSRRIVIMSVVAALMLKALVYNAFGNVDVGSAFWRMFFSYQEPILFGVLAAFALNRRRWYEFFTRWLASPWTLISSGGALMLMISLHHTQTQSTWDAQFMYLLMTLTTLGLVVRTATPLICSRALTHVGKISYGIYLIHMFILGVIKPSVGFSPALCFLVEAVTVIAIASLVYQYFESPIINYYKKRLSPFNQAEKAPRSPETLPAYVPLGQSESGQ